jgi:plasmid replication initiation protein
LIKLSLGDNKMNEEKNEVENNTSLYIPDWNRFKVDNQLARARTSIKSSLELNMYVIIIKKLADNAERLWGKQVWADILRDGAAHPDTIKNQTWMDCSFPVNEINELKNINLTEQFYALGGKEYTEIKNAARNIAKSIIEMEDVKNHSFTVMTIFTEVRYKKGFIYAGVNFNMLPFIVHISKQFTQFPITDFIKLTSSYSKHLYMLLKSNKSLGQFEMLIVELHKFLLVSEYVQKNFGELVRILERAKKEIETKTDLRFAFSFLKGSRGKKIEIVAFHFPQPELFTKEVLEDIQQNNKGTN